MDGTGRIYGEARTSAARAAIARALDRFPGAFTVGELTRAVRDAAPRVGTATVYRAVTALLDAGALESVGTRDGHALYVRCDASGHHHHMVCTGCGAVEHAPCPVDAGTLAHARARGFEITGHRLDIYGLCGRCAAAAAGGTGGDA